MKKISTAFLQMVIVLIGIVALVVLIRFPLTEGRAVNLDLLSIYLDPFIIYGYVASSVFFIALYQAFKFISYIGQNRVFSADCVRALRNIKYCAIVLGIFIVGAATYISAFHDPADDAAGFISLCIMTTFGSVVVATAAAVFERTLQSAVEIKSENDLTV